LGAKNPISEQQGPVGELTRIHFGEKKTQIDFKSLENIYRKDLFQTPDLKTLFQSMNLPIKTGTLVPTPRSLPNKSFFGSC
jgi:hypothetical protein